MLALIRRTGREFGISIVLSTHLMGDVETTCDRIIVLERGQVVESGEVSGFTQETETIFIDVDGGAEFLMSALSERGLDCALDGYSVAVQDVGAEQYDKIRDTLADSGVRLRRLGPRRHRLTEIFREQR